MGNPNECPKAISERDGQPRPRTIRNVRAGVLMVGDVAYLCHVSTRTVAKWCDRHGLKHHRIPGGDDRRILLGDLRDWMKAKGFPIHHLMEEISVVCIGDCQPPPDGVKYQLHQCPLLGAMAIQQYRPRTVVFGPDVGTSSILSLLDHLGKMDYKTAVIVMSAESPRDGLSDGRVTLLPVGEANWHGRVAVERSL